MPEVVMAAAHRALSMCSILGILERVSQVRCTAGKPAPHPLPWCTRCLQHTNPPLLLLLILGWCNEHLSTINDGCCIGEGSESLWWSEKQSVNSSPSSIKCRERSKGSVRNAKSGIFLIKLHPLKFFQVNLQTNQVLNQHPLKTHTPLLSAFIQTLLGITETN